MSREKYTFSTDTLGGMLLEMSARQPEADALVFPDDKRSFNQIADDAIKKARSLQALGVKPGDHVGILLPTCCLLYTSPSPRDQRGSRMPSSA